MSYETQLQDNNSELQNILNQINSLITADEVLELANQYTDNTAAPTGFGLGDFCVQVDTWNNAKKNGYYFSNIDGPDNSTWWGYVVNNNGYGEQRVFKRQDGIMVEANRSFSDDVFEDWEWVNPPLEPGIEYRTTQRYNNSPVFVKMVECGFFPNASTKEVTHGVDNIDKIIKAEATSDALGSFLPIYIKINNTISPVATVYATQDSITVYSADDWSAYQCFTTIYYTKTVE